MCSQTYHNHGDSEVRSQLIITPGTGGPVAVLIDASFMDQLRVFLIWVLGVSRHPETCLKGLLQLLVPLGVQDQPFFTCNTENTWGHHRNTSVFTHKCVCVGVCTVYLHFSALIWKESFGTKLHNPAHCWFTETNYLHSSTISVHTQTFTKQTLS